MGDERRVHGYGADLGVEGIFVVIWPGKAMARMAGTKRIEVPVHDIADVEYKAASRLVNGQVRFKVHDESPARLNWYGGRTLPLAGTPEARAFIKEGLVTTQTLVVHWRHKDQAVFADLVEEIRAKVAAVAGVWEGTRRLDAELDAEADGE